MKIKTDAREAKAEQVQANKDARAEKQQSKRAMENSRGSAVVQALSHTKHIDALKVADIRAALAFKGITHDAKALRPALRLLLAQTAGLPSGGEVPPLVLAEARGRRYRSFKRGGFLTKR